MYLVYIIYTTLYLRIVGWIEKSVTICSCAQVFGIKAGMLLVTNRLNVSFLWEPFSRWIGNYQTEIHMLPHTDLLPLPTLPSPFMLSMTLNMRGIFNGPSFGGNLLFWISFFLKVLYTVLNVLFFFLNHFGHQFNNSGTEFYCLLTVPFFSWIKRHHVYCDVKVTL